MQSVINIKNISKNPNVLLIGDAGEDAVNITDADISLSRFSSFADAAGQLTAGSFGVVLVAAERFDCQLESELRKIRPNAERIFLLTKMLCEPSAAKFIKSTANGSKPADDYYIMPVSLTVGRAKAGATAEQTTKPAAVPAAVEESKAGEDYENIIAVQQQRIDILEQLVMQDELTGVKNRRFAREFLRQIIENADRSRLQVTLLLFDIDNFKRYNDLYGHPVGDNILKQAAVLMQKCCRRQDIVARIGGDEFAVIFWNVSAGSSIEFNQNQERRASDNEHPKEVIDICKRFRKELNDTDLPALGADGKGVLTISGGLATFPRDGSNVIELFKKADDRLLDAKKSGKNKLYLIGKAD